jgi:hypothetical protein
MRKQKLQLAILMSAMGMAAQAQAAMETQSVVVGPTAVGNNLTFDIAQFNTSLGTLNSVDLTLTPTFDFGYSVINAGSTPLTVTFASVSDPQAALSSAIGLNGTWSSSQTLERQNFVVNPGVNSGSLPFIFTSSPSSVTSVIVGPTGFTGSGTYDLVLDNPSLPATSGGSPGLPLFYGFYGNVGGSLEVTYNYTAVPEPVSTAEYAGLSALGLFGLATLRRKFPRAA